MSVATIRPGAPAFAPHQQWPHVGQMWPRYNNWDPQDENLVAWWPTLASAGGNVLRDLVGGNDGAITEEGTGIAEWINSEIGPVVRVIPNDEAGVNVGYVNLGTLPISSFSAISMCIRFKANTLSSFRRYFSIQHSGGDDYRIYLTNNELIGAFDDGTAVNLTTPFTDTSDYHLAILTYDGGNTIKLFLDGFEVDSDTDTPNLAGAGGLAYLGSLAGNASGQTAAIGNLGDARLLDYAVSPSLAYQMWAPSTRDDLYLPTTPQWWKLGAEVAPIRIPRIPATYNTLQIY